MKELFRNHFQPNLRLILTSGELTPASSETGPLLTVLGTPLSSDYSISLDKARHVFVVRG